MDRIHTLQEVADRLRLPYRVVRDAVFAGEWPHVRVSQRRRLMSESDVVAVIAQLHRDPVPAESRASSRMQRDRVRRLINER